MKRTSLRLVIIIVSALIVVLAVAAFVYACRPYSRTGMSRCTAVVETRSVLCISADGCRNMYFTCTDGTSMQGLSFSRGEVESASFSTAVWVNDNPFYPSAHGKLISADIHTPLFCSADSINAHLTAVVDSTIVSVDRLAVSLDKKRKEFTYYLDRHNVIDEGFNSIADLSADNDKRISELAQLREELVKMKNNGHASVKAMQTFRVGTVAETSDSLAYQVCTYEASDGVSMSLRTLTDDIPDGAVSISIPPFMLARPDSGDLVFLSGYYSVPGSEPAGEPVAATACMTTDNRHNFPRFGMSNFSPVFTSCGFFAGCVSSDSIVRHFGTERLF